MTLRLSRRFGPWVGHHALEFKWFYAGAFLCLYVLQVLQAELPERIRNLTLLLNDGNLIKASVWVFVGLAVGILIFRTFSRLLFFYPARVQQKTLRMELLSLLENVPPDRYHGKSQGQLFQVLFDDINNLRAFIGFGLLQIGNLVIAAWVLIPKLNETDAYLWPAFIPLFSSVILFSVMTMINQRIFKKMMDKKGEVQQYIIEAYEAKQTIKNFHREESFIQGFVKVSGEELALFYKSAIGFAFTGPYVKLGLGASLLWGGILIKARGGGPSDLVFFSGFLYLFLEPVMFLSWVAVVVSQGFAAWRRVKELYALLDAPTESEKEIHASHPEITATQIAMDLTFWNKKLKIVIPTQKWTALIGETGCGKSFFLTRIATTLILKKYNVTMVQQEPYLFNDTIGGNIFLGREVTAEEEQNAKDLLVLFQLDSLAASLDGILKLEVGENGKRLSGGQLKRVALIRSLMSGSEIIIWDDPFSSVDIILERKIIRLIKQNPKWKNFTFIISSHRLTTVRLSDEVIYVDREVGVRSQAPMLDAMKEVHVSQFFKEQLLETPLA
ncbi:MAG: ABC transporter ATP-binding protein [Bdellovibrionales bacterium]|nr:ABC transporter ATP-binding protein [Bdellovibrionales bacterium]